MKIYLAKTMKITVKVFHNNSNTFTKTTQIQSVQKFFLFFFFLLFFWCCMWHFCLCSVFFLFALLCFVLFVLFVRIVVHQRDVQNKESQKRNFSTLQNTRTNKQTNKQTHTHTHTNTQTNVHAVLVRCRDSNEIPPAISSLVNQRMIFCFFLIHLFFFSVICFVVTSHVACCL